MKKLLFYIIFLFFGNFISRAQITDRYFFFDSYISGIPGSWAYSNRMIGYNAITFNTNKYLTVNGSFYFPVIYSNNFNYGLYEISIMLKYPLSRRLFTGLKIRLMNFFNGLNELPPTDWYLAGGMSYIHPKFHITFELGNWHPFHSEEIFPVISSALKTKINSRVFCWIELRHFVENLYNNEWNFTDVNTGISIFINVRTQLDIGLAFENNIDYNAFRLMKLSTGIIYPLIGLQWQISKPQARENKTDPFYERR